MNLGKVEEKWLEGSRGRIYVGLVISGELNSNPALTLTPWSKDSPVLREQLNDFIGCLCDRTSALGGAAYLFQYHLLNAISTVP